MHKLLFILLFFTNSVFSQIVINEIMSSNHNCIVDEDGDNSDWIELYNYGNTKVDLTGYYLSDNDELTLRWKFPEVFLKPNDYLIIFASGKDRSISDKELHTNFRISKNGEPIILTDSNNQQVDRLPPSFVETDYSYGRFPDGSDSLYIFKSPTPREANSGQIAPPKNVKLSFSHRQGYFLHDFLLSINSSEEVEIRYTIDASVPTDTSMIYQKAISIDSRRTDSNNYSEIPTAEPDHWLPPLTEVKKMNVVRARPFINSIPVGKEIWGTFWTGHHNPKNISLPIVSIITDPQNLFDYETGIYVPGKYFDLGKNSNAHQKGDDWERNAIFSFFDENGEIKVDQNVGIRIHGGATRRYRQKSLRIYARNRYGKDNISYQFFPDRTNYKFKRLLLNSTMGDWSATLFKDELCTYLVRGLDIDYLEFIPVISFINGEYWGIQFIKERRDNYYIAQNHNVDSNNIDRLFNNSVVKSGSKQHYEEMMSYIKTSDNKNPKTYETIKEYMDVKNFIDYKCMHIYFNNRDWPHNNVEYWRQDTLGGKWRWIFWDLDGGFRAYQEDNLSVFLDDQIFVQEYNEWGFKLLRELLKIPQFKQDFTNRFYYHIENTVRPDIVLDAIDNFKNTLKPYMPDHINRWQFPKSMYEWEENLTVLESFAILRPAEILDILKNNLLSPFIIAPNPVSNNVYIYYEEETQKNSEIRIYNISGQQIDISSRIITNEPYFKINVNDLSQGIYIVQIINNGIIFTNKILKIK